VVRRACGNNSDWARRFHDTGHPIRLHGASRQRVLREVFEQFWQYV